VRIYANNRRSLKYAAICCGAGLLGVLAGRASWWVGLPIAVLFFTLTLFLVFSALSRAPRITIGEEGLGGAELPHLLAWAEIVSIEHVTRSARYRTLHLLRLTSNGGETFELPLSDLLTSPAAIIEEVERFHAVSAA
jgi:hypothetical protein